MLKISKLGRWREFIQGVNVPGRVLLEDFDWLDDPYGDCGFMRHKGRWFHLSNFTPSPIPGFQGVEPSGWYSGHLLQISADGERYRLAYYHYTYNIS